MKNHYKTLGVSEKASEEEVRNRWIHLMRKHHPDRAGESADNQRVREINEAYEILKEASSRARYDLRRTCQRKKNETSALGKVLRKSYFLLIPLVLWIAFFSFRNFQSLPPQMIEKGAASGVAPVAVTERVPPEENIRVKDKPSHQATDAVSRNTEKKEPLETMPERPAGVLKEVSRRNSKEGVGLLTEEPSHQPREAVPRETKKEGPLKIVNKTPAGPSKETLSKLPKEGEGRKEIKEAISQKIPGADSLPRKANRTAPVAQGSPEPFKPEHREVKDLAGPKKAEEKSIPGGPAKDRGDAIKVDRVEQDRTGSADPAVPRQTPEALSVRIPDPSDTPKPANVPMAHAEEVHRFIDSYLACYMQKDIAGFLRFFSPGATQNSNEDFSEIRRIYTLFFEQSQTLVCLFKNPRTEILSDRIHLWASYEIVQVDRTGDRRLWRGNAEWTLIREGGDLKVSRLQYQHDRSS